MKMCLAALHLVGALLVVVTASGPGAPLEAPPVAEEEAVKALLQFLPEATDRCIEANCSKPLLACVRNLTCARAVACDARCQLEKDVNSCNMACELTVGYNNTQYRALVQCMAEHKCLPQLKPEGMCLATDSDAVKNLTSMEQLKGKWWVLKGLNCGQDGWPGGSDSKPCQRSLFAQDGSQWVNHAAYCEGSNNTCSSQIISTMANASITSPGVITHLYIDAPLLPQLDHWRVLSWPHPDWMMYIYCGRTPMGLYAGGAVVSNSSTSISAIPSYVKTTFTTVAQKFKFDYDKMCVSDTTKCTD